MIQVYKPDNTDFDSNGDMTLMPTEALIHVILGSTWEASLTHPVDDDGRWQYIEQNAVVKMPSFNGEQLWRIVITEKSDDEVTATMQPIFYDCANEVFLTDVRPTDKDAQAALDILMDGTKYTGISDIETCSTAYYEYVNLLEALAGDIDQSFINRWGGEIIYDNFVIQINERAGEDNGVEIRYGKNLPQNGLTITEDMSDVVTRIYPKGYGGTTMSNSGYVDSDRISDYPVIRAAAITFDYIYYTADMDDDEIADLKEDENAVLCATQDELDAALTEACQAEFDEGLDLPALTIDAEMILLQNTEQYKDVEVLESVSIGDTVHVVDTNLDFTTELRVIELEYDPITEEIKSVVLGDFEYDYFTSSSQTVSKLEDSTDGSTITDYANALKLESAVGSGTNPIYFKKTGIPVASSSTVGGTATPVYLNDGKITKLSDSIGDDATPVYLKGGEITELSETVGGTATPVYLKDGEITELYDSVGGVSVPVYLNNGKITACTSVTAAKANSLTTAPVGDSSTPIYIDSDGIPQVCDLDTLADSLDVSGDYLPLSGGTLSGDLIIGSSSLSDNGANLMVQSDITAYSVYAEHDITTDTLYADNMYITGEIYAAEGYNLLLQATSDNCGISLIGEDISLTGDNVYINISHSEAALWIQADTVKIFDHDKCSLYEYVKGIIDGDITE